MNQSLEKALVIILWQTLMNNMKELKDIDDIRLSKLIKNKNNNKEKQKKLFLAALKTMDVNQRLEALEEKIFELCYSQKNNK